MSFLNRFLPEQPQDDVLQSVVRNLLYLLNSRRGFGSLLCSFGAAEYLRDLSGRSATQTLLRDRQIPSRSTSHDCVCWASDTSDAMVH